VPHQQETVANGEEVDRDGNRDEDELSGCGIGHHGRQQQAGDR
jgi:hypothetical protein